MSSLVIDVVDAWNAAGIARARAVRHAVFVGEFAITEAEEFDDLDTIAGTVHVVATLDGADVGTARLVTDPDRIGVVHFTRVAVLATARCSGAGRALMDTLEQIALDRYATGDPPGVRVELSVMASAAGFYRSLGYTVYPAVYLEVRVAHHAAHKNLVGR